MTRLSLGRGAWPWLVVLLGVVFAAGCQDGSGPSLITSSEGKPAYDGAKPPPPPPPNPEIATRDFGIANSIYVMNADGSNYRRVIYVGSLVYAHSWSPDGAAITYAGAGGIWIVNVDGTNNHRLVSNAEIGPDRVCGAVTWSPLGGEIAFIAWNHGVGTQDVMVVPVGGGGLTTLYSAPPELSSSLEWNHDGTRLILGLANDLIVIDRATRTGTTVLSDFSPIGWVDWGRRGLDTILFSAEGNIYTLDISDPSATPELIVAAGRAGCDFPSFSPDNSKFVYYWRVMAGWHSGRSGLATYTFATGEITQIDRVEPLRPDWRR